jgi:hypothetical protein
VTVYELGTVAQILFQMQRLKADTVAVTDRATGRPGPDRNDIRSTQIEFRSETGRNVAVDCFTSKYHSFPLELKPNFGDTLKFYSNDTKIQLLPQCKHNLCPL